MLEHADASEMCISEMAVIFKSLDVVSASERVAESVSVRFGDSAVDIGFKRGIAADYATTWMDGNVVQQRWYATEQRVSSAGDCEQCERSVCCEQREESASCEQHDGGVCCERRGRGREEPDGWRETSVDWVSNVLHHHDAESRGKTRKMSRRTGSIMTMMRNANRLSEVKYKNFVEQCVRHLEEKEMWQVSENAGRLFLRETLWDRWSRGLSFAMKMSGPDVRETQSELCRSQLTRCSPRRGSCLTSKSEYVAEELSMRRCNKDERTKTHVKNLMLMVFRGLKRERERVTELKFAKDEGSG